MKKAYVSPELELVEFDTLDVITTSGFGDGDIELPDQPLGEMLFEADLD